MNKKSIQRGLGNRIYQASLAYGQVMWRVGILGAFALSIAFIATFISIIVNEGFVVFSTVKEFLVLVMVFMEIVLILIIAWGRIRIMLGRKPVEMPNEFAILLAYHARGLIYLLNAIGVISLVLIPMMVLGLFTGAYDKP